MNTKLHIATILGIPIFIHWSFSLILAYAAFNSVRRGENLEGVVLSVLFIFALYFCVILHELGHAFAARRYGIGTRDIIMYPIGGVAMLEGIPRKPLHELVVAIAGPMVNVVIAGLIFVGLLVSGAIGKLCFLYDDRLQGNFIGLLFATNLVLVIFNMIPAFPMDGGRVFRALIAMTTTRLRATFIAMWVGRIFAMIFVGIGLWSVWTEIQNYVWGAQIDVQTAPFLAVIGIFIYFGAKREYQMEEDTHNFAENRVYDIMYSKFTFLQYNDPMQHAFDILFKGAERDFLVGTPEGKICGVLSQEAIEEAYKNKQGAAEIRDFVLINFEPLAPNDSVETAFSRMKKGGFPLLPVVYQNKLIGVVALETVKLMARFRQ